VGTNTHGGESDVFGGRGAAVGVWPVDSGIVARGLRYTLDLGVWWSTEVRVGFVCRALALLVIRSASFIGPISSELSPLRLNRFSGDHALVTLESCASGVP